jgi:hypothetical protein
VCVAVHRRDTSQGTACTRRWAVIIMAKRSKNRRAPPPPKRNDTDFVRVVQWIYRSGVTYSQNLVTINGTPIGEWRSLSPGARVEAYKVAIGLTAIRKAIDLLPPDPDGSVVHAGELLDALVGRTDTSAWRYVLEYPFGPTWTPTRR